MNQVPQSDPAHAIGSFEELRWLAGTLRGLDRAAAATQWDDGDAKRWTHHVRSFGSRASELGARIAAELRHIAADSPRSVLARTVVTLGISLSLVAVHHLTGAKRHDLTGLTLYLFSAVVGSVVCTNTLCFEAERVRAGLVRGERIWQILVAKNIAMAALVTAAGLPVVAALTLTAGANPVVLVDQLVTMVIIWLGVGNVLSVVYPLRYEPMSASDFTTERGSHSWSPSPFPTASGSASTCRSTGGCGPARRRTPGSQAEPGSRSSWRWPAPPSAGCC